MKKIAAVLLLLLITLSSMVAKSYVGLSLSPYFEFGSGSWMGKDGDSDAAINVTHDEKLFVFGAEFRLDLGLYKTWGKHSLGVEVGTGIALPVIHKNDVGNAAIQINDIPLYTYALTPYIALTSIPLQMISHLEQDLESNPQWDGSMRDLMTEMQPRDMPMTTSNTSSTFQ